MTLQQNFTRRSDYRAGELCEAEEIQREPEPRNWPMALTWWSLVAWCVAVIAVAISIAS